MERESHSFYLKNILIYSLFGDIALMILTFVTAFIFLKMSLPLDMSGIPIIISSGIAGCVSGYLCGRRIKEKGWMLGLLCGVAIWLTLFIVGLFFSSPAFTGVSIAKLLFIIGGAMVGGMLGVNKRGKKVKF